MSNDRHKKKIVIAMPLLLLGGTEIHTLSLVEALVAAEHDVTVCCYYEYDESVTKRFRHAGAKVDLLKLRRSEGLTHLLRKLIIFFKATHPDIVHVQYLAPGLVPIIAAQLDRISTIFATVHIAGSIAYGKKAKILLRFAAKLCTAFFCVSKGVEEFWFSDSEVFDPDNVNKCRKHFTVYNAVDTARIDAIVSAVDKSKLKALHKIAGQPVFGIVGRLTYQKGHMILLNSMAEVIKQFPDVVLLIIGEGPDCQKLGKRAAELDLNKNIRWLGAQPQDKVFEFYSIMDVFVMPSLYEGFGFTAAEAMAAGVPVVGTKIEGLSEIIEDGVTGYLIPANDSKKLSDALLNLLTDSEKAKMMGTKGSQRVKELFSLEVFKKSVLAAYEMLSK
jgi:L-malate glycosyltransferase